MKKKWRPISAALLAGRWGETQLVEMVTEALVEAGELRGRLSCALVEVRGEPVAMQSAVRVVKGLIWCVQGENPSAEGGQSMLWALGS